MEEDNIDPLVAPPLLAQPTPSLYYPPSLRLSDICAHLRPRNLRDSWSTHICVSLSLPSSRREGEAPRKFRATPVLVPRSAEEPVDGHAARFAVSRKNGPARHFIKNKFPRMEPRRISEGFARISRPLASLPAPPQPRLTPPF